MSEDKIDVVIELYAKDPTPATVEAHKKEHEKVSAPVINFIKKIQGEIVAEVWLNKTIKARILEQQIQEIKTLPNVKNVNKAKNVKPDQEFITPIDEILFRDGDIVASDKDFDRLSKDTDYDDEG